jgi:hypothetical protein
MPTQELYNSGLLFWSAPFFLLNVVHLILPELIYSKVALSLVALQMAP